MKEELDTMKNEVIKAYQAEQQHAKENKLLKKRDKFVKLNCVLVEKKANIVKQRLASLTGKDREERRKEIEERMQRMKQRRDEERKQESEYGMDHWRDTFDRESHKIAYLFHDDKMPTVLRMLGYPKSEHDRFMVPYPDDADDFDLGWPTFLHAY